METERRSTNWTWVCRIFGHEPAWKSLLSSKELRMPETFMREFSYCGRCFAVPPNLWNGFRGITPLPKEKRNVG